MKNSLSTISFLFSGHTFVFWQTCLFVIFAISSCEKNEKVGQVADIEGNIYKTVTIGEQVWMAENLKVTKFNDGTEIKLVESNEEWQNATTSAFSWYHNDSSLFGNQYGALYNGYVAQSRKICPTGWHVPSVNNMLTLIESLDGDELTVGGKLKEESVAWHEPNTGANNSSQFSALPSGMRYFEGTFSSASYIAGYWSSIEVSADSMTFMSLSYLDEKVSFVNTSKKTGLSIRCVKNSQ